ncbi:DUF1071 domain-containing protein [Acidovorax sp.]|uniref:Sak single strand annealing protein n=1 Tax=Acidovorax sp. TaxID=1872122 RepID=UPI0027BB002E|nr:DUF1071 domain-containing protein [Acidovorax sp.]
MKFFEGLSVPIKGLVATVEGKNYLPWPTGLALAGRPRHKMVSFTGSPWLKFFGGGVVAVESDGQLVYLPIMDAKFRAIPADLITARDVNDSQKRALAKTLAMCHGIGMSLYGGHGEDVEAFFGSLNVQPGCNLAAVMPPVEEKPGSNSEYVEWAVAYSAARIVHPDFRFEVLCSEVPDADTGVVQRLPYTRINNTYSVAVQVTYTDGAHQVEHVEWLPIMGVQMTKVKAGEKKLDHQALLSPTVTDWNRSIMRCLTRAIAETTGYGLAVYAQEDLEALHGNVEGSAYTRTAKRESAKAATRVQQGAQAPENRTARGSDAVERTNSAASQSAGNLAREAIEAIRRAGRDTEADNLKLMAWLGEPADKDIASLSEVQHQRILRVVAKQAEEVAQKVLAKLKETGKDKPADRQKLMQWLGEDPSADLATVPIPKLEKALKALDPTPVH